MISKKTQDIAKQLLREIFVEGGDISLLPRYLLSIDNSDEAEFKDWFNKLVELNKCFIRYKNADTKENYDALIAQIQDCGYDKSWIDSVIENIVKGKNDKEREEEERELKEEEHEHKAEEEHKLKDAERERIAEEERKLKEENERKRKEAERERIAEEERKFKEEEEHKLKDAEHERIAEEERKFKEEEERKRKEAEREHIAEEERKRKEAERERKAEEEKRERIAEEERKRKEAERERIAEEERKRKEAERERIAEEERKRKEAERERIAEEERKPYYWYLLKTLIQYADFSGRARKKEYCTFVLFNIIIFILFLYSITMKLYIMWYVCYLAAMFLPYLAVSVRRLHDLDKSGWLILTGFIPVVGVILLPILMSIPGQKGTNQYGDDPKLSNEITKSKNILWSIPCILAGIAIALVLSGIFGKNEHDKPEISEETEISEEPEINEEPEEPEWLTKYWTEYAKADTCFVAGKYEEAKAGFEQVLELIPPNDDSDKRNDVEKRISECKDRLAAEQKKKEEDAQKERELAAKRDSLVVLKKKKENDEELKNKEAEEKKKNEEEHLNKLKETYNPLFINEKYMLGVDYMVVQKKISATEWKWGIIVYKYGKKKIPFIYDGVTGPLKDGCYALNIKEKGLWYVFDTSANIIDSVNFLDKYIER
jgi:uncharacterized membrane protein YhaH (DUF805 family)